MQLALDSRLGPFDEDFRPLVGAVRPGQLTAVGANVRGNHAALRRKGLGILILAHLGSPFHELGPDRQRRFRAFQVQFAVVVEAHPDHA